MPDSKRGMRTSIVAILANAFLAAVKIVTGLVGNSYALVADGIESTTDIFSSILVWSGLRIARRPPDENHPYGHGKAESVAGLLVAIILVAAALLIAFNSIREIVTPHHVPAWYTLPVLLLVIIIKESLFRYAFKAGSEIGSTSVSNDAWHHRSDAITSIAAFVGISIALIGGEEYAPADDWAALFSCIIILYNGVRLIQPALDEIMDATVDEDLTKKIIKTALEVNGVRAINKCRVRKSGLSILMDIHIAVDGKLSVTEGHAIGHEVEDRLLASDLPVEDIVVHVEPDDD